MTEGEVKLRQIVPAGFSLRVLCAVVAVLSDLETTRDIRGLVPGPTHCSTPIRVSYDELRTHSLKFVESWSLHEFIIMRCFLLKRKKNSVAKCVNFHLSPQFTNTRLCYMTWIIDSWVKSRKEEVKRRIV